jgi:hypothetical protein
MRKLFKSLILSAMLLMLAMESQAQCDVTRCVGENLILNGTTNATQPQYTWTAPLAFTGQATAQITFTALPVGNFTVGLSVVDLATGCVNDTIFNVCVQEGVASLVLPEICVNEPCIPISGGSGAGVYTIGGVTVTQLCPSDAGALVTFTSTSGTCPGTATATFNVNPLPTIGISAQ